MSVLSESPVPENGTPGSMRGMWRRGYGLAHRAPPNERGGNSDATAYGYRATSLLYTSSRRPAKIRLASIIKGCSKYLKSEFKIVGNPKMKLLHFLNLSI
jgi:hypothetical protein